MIEINKEMRLLTMAEVLAVGGGDGIVSCIWECWPVPDAGDPPVASGGVTGGNYHCELVCGEDPDFGGPYPPI